MLNPKQIQKQQNGKTQNGMDGKLAVTPASVLEFNV